MTQSAPPELTDMGLDRYGFFYSGQDSWRGPCPKCGGSRRFVVFTNRPWPHFYGMCDQCQLKGWADQINPRLASLTQVDPMQRAIYEMEGRQQRQNRESERRSRLAEFSTSELYEELHERMTDDNRLWWETQGVFQYWQDFWHLGYTPERSFEFEGQHYTRPAYTIPKFTTGWVLQNIDYRLVNPPEGVGKYRPEPGLPAASFLTRPDFDTLFPDGTAIVVEGSKKAMVVCSNLSGNPQIAGVPSCNSWAGLEKELQNLDRVYILMDPDAQVWAYRKARDIGAQARIVQSSVKIDDAFIHYGMTERDFRSLLKQARKVM